MHTSSLQAGMFEVELAGAPASVGELVPDWDRFDRFGIVVHEPMGLNGAGLLTQALIATFFEHRREHHPEDLPVYPEIYAFHVGGRYGDFSMYDFWPGGKEVFVEDDPIAVAHAINERAITRLAVPDGPVRPHGLLWPEYGSVMNRTRSAWAYSADGNVPQPDVVLSCVAPQPLDNTNATFEIERRLEELFAPATARARTMAQDPDFSRWAAAVRARRDEVPERARMEAAELLHARTDAGGVTERVRRISVRAALGRLALTHPQRDSDLDSPPRSMVFV